MQARSPWSSRLHRSSRCPHRDCVRPYDALIEPAAIAGRDEILPATGFPQAGSTDVFRSQALFRSARFADVGSTARVAIRLLNDMTSQSAAPIMAVPGRDRWHALVRQRSRRSPAILPNTERLCENISISATACTVYLNRRGSCSSLSGFPLRLKRAGPPPLAAVENLAEGSNFG